MNSLQSALNNSKTNEELLNLFGENSKITVQRTFFGGREVVIENYKGSLSFIKIMEKYFSINKPTFKSYSESENEEKINVLKDRLSAFDFKNKIDELQKETPEYEIPKGLIGLIVKISLCIRRTLIADNNSILEEKMLNNYNPMLFRFYDYEELFGVKLINLPNPDTYSDNGISRNNFIILKKNTVIERIKELTPQSK
ncbi:MAG: hypothetical protein ChlgKO_14860 [Chlamydiales bacterium]